MSNKYEEASKKSAERTNLKHAQKITEMTSFDTQKLDKFFPTQVDKEKLVKLIQIVNSSTTENEKISEIQKNISEFADTVIKLTKYIMSR